MKEREVAGIMYEACCICRKVRSFKLVYAAKEAGKVSHGLCKSCAENELKKLDDYVFKSANFES